MKNTWSCLLASALIATVPAAFAQADWKPSKTVTFVVPVAPGSSNDMIARLLAEKLPARLGQGVVVDNRPGATGLIGAASVARSAPDGHTIMIAPSDIYMAPLLQPKGGGTNVDVVKDLSPIVNAGAAPILIVAQPSTGVKTPAELLAWLKKTGPAPFSSPGNGSPMHIAGELFTRSTGLKLDHVPYKGVMPAVNAVLASETPLGIVALAGAAPSIEAGKLVPVALVQKERSSLAPNVPTLTESGIKGVEVAVFFQILAPAKTPKPVIDRYNKEINELLASADLKAQLTKMGVQVTGGSVAEAVRDAHDTYERNVKLVKELNITVE
jgi:tripartite-type tricarboxylate transporter receptor subunit TctC